MGKRAVLPRRAQESRPGQGQTKESEAGGQRPEVRLRRSSEVQENKSGLSLRGSANQGEGEAQRSLPVCLVAGGQPGWHLAELLSRFSAWTLGAPTHAAASESLKTLSANNRSTGA
ncbi:hypothetical protein VULLAG_LOCUS23952 [Vulpes lagopus]